MKYLPLSGGYGVGNTAPAAKVISADGDRSPPLRAGPSPTIDNMAVLI